METSKEEQRWQFVDDMRSGHWSMTELCERYGISRPTGYKWVARLSADPDWSRDRSRAPTTCPHRTTPEREQRLLALRARYGWGATKLVTLWAREYPHGPPLARSTINAILARHGKLRRTRRRVRWQHPGAGGLATTRPNQVWPADFKGHFKLGNGRYCYPLTVTDHFSRKLLAVRAFPAIDTTAVMHAFRTLFRTCGLPDAIRTDNGAPFASRALCGLAPLNVWWRQLGIVPQRIHPGSPQENGQHERMHRELKREATRPPAGSHRGQQRKLDQWQRRYNNDRPHEALAGAVPSARWTPSPRAYPERVRAPEYPGHLHVAPVTAAGTFRLNHQEHFLSTALRDELIGLEEVGDGVWNIVYYTTLLAKIDERTGEITGDML